MAYLTFRQIEVQGQTIIVVPLSGKFGKLPIAKQHGVISLLEEAAERSGMTGHIVPMWRYGKTTQVIAPLGWHQYFQAQGVYESILEGEAGQLEVANMPPGWMLKEPVNQRPTADS